MHLLAAPAAALLATVLGFVGIYAEFLFPGRVVFGAAGAALATLGLNALAHLPIGWPAIALLLGGVALLVLEACVASRGILTVLGAAVMTFGAISLPVQTALAIAICAPFAVLTSFLLTLGVRARRNKAIGTI